MRSTTQTIIRVPHTIPSPSLDAMNVFNVDHSLGFLVGDRVPFDTYFLSALVVVVDKATNESVPIIKFSAGEGPDGFVVSSNDSSVKSKYTYDSGTGPTTVEIESRMVNIMVKRSMLSRAFTMCLLLVNSGLAIGSTYVMLLVFFGRNWNGDKPDSTVLLLPLTIVLTIPTLRGLYPGSPPFGVYIGRSHALKSNLTTDATPRYIRALLADDDGCGVLHDTVT